jgi:hypothetical protein
MPSQNKKKILKNTTNSVIELSQIGISVPALGQVTIEPGQYFIFANEVGQTPNSQIDTYIYNQQIVVNDGIRDLIPSQGVELDRAIDYLKHPDTAFNLRFLAEPERPNGFVSNNVQEAIEEARSAIEGKLSALPTYLNNGLTSNKWLKLDGSMGSSDILPAITSYDSKLAGITYVNTNDGSNVDIEFYKNGILPANLLFTWQIRNKRHAFKTNGLTAVLLSKGDRLSCFAKAVTGTSARDVIVNVFIQSTNSLTDEGGGSTGIT